ncbi:hypothetical protein [Pseudomonas aeruginosa]|uniref:Ead/Ea22-like family protein n=2 Tax=Pseudomonas aeruginosa TaxID=287 RepID=A0A367LYC8_PSEAI|nr:hypothetical protein [Pseudomonas aeruginosa]MBA4870785.1 hypothetical protein [Pseudomonas aeruginosa]MBA4988960.1 hypothetical protein [Pseudomonas aeruginosa]MBG5398103.1 hypothetical protein [Pseudomonas aeruginosa]MBH4255563.1 hypothetical protein [Pseudomonas aeruginosa]MCS7773727.1 hypothetical protein [Pseudomonas aeruginosa]
MTDTNKLKELAAQYLANPSGTAGEDSEFRAAANPQAILGLIAEIERLNALLKAEKYAYKDKQKHYEWLEEDLKECASALPGTYYMDPPDGGNVSIPEQIRRMAKDAARYRWLRGASHFDTPQHQAFCKAYGDALDYEIDAAIEGATQ